MSQHYCRLHADYSPTAGRHLVAAAIDDLIEQMDQRDLIEGPPVA
jgi:hypothetical protein